MSRDTFVIRNGKLVPKRLAQPLINSTDPKVHVISDVMRPLKHMGTGRIHDSKAAFRADTKAMGCEEVGNDPAASRDIGLKRVEPSMSEIVQDVKRSLQELRSR